MYDPFRRCLASVFVALAAASATALTAPRTTATPIEHLIIVVGENLTFDNLFATYRPGAGQMVGNLLSRGIVNADGSPGLRFADAVQRQASVIDRYSAIPVTGAPFAVLPQPGTTYATGLPQHVPDARFPADLPNGPYRITQYAPYTAAVGDPVHRFFQMWQQVDGGKKDLFTWVAVTSGEGSLKRDDPTSGTNQGGVAMGFYSMSQGDAPFLRELAQTYAIADNYHQAVMGGTGANFVALSTGDALVFLQGGRPSAPPPSQIENPDPRPGTNNWYTQSGYRSGSYVACADSSQPGVATIRNYLSSLPYKTFNDGNCAPGSYYLVNNYDTGYTFDGKPKELGSSRFVAPPQIAPNIGTALAKDRKSVV